MESMWSTGLRRCAAALALIAAATGGAVLLARPRPRGAAVGGGQAARFVGSGACAACHPVEQAAWSSSHHRHAMEPADATSVLGDFDDVRFRTFGRETRFWRRGSTFQVTTENQRGE